MSWMTRPEKAAYLGVMGLLVFFAAAALWACYRYAPPNLAALLGGLTIYWTSQLFTTLALGLRLRWPKDVDPQAAREHVVQFWLSRSGLAVAAVQSVLAGTWIGLMTDDLLWMTLAYLVGRHASQKALGANLATGLNLVWRLAWVTVWVLASALVTGILRQWLLR